MSWVNKGFRAGDWVQVKEAEEILATLDENGRYDELPFMPEMLQHCGKRYRVFKSAHKTCDTVNHSGGRRMLDAVHLKNLRCNGAAHNECQANCLIFWKNAWLRPIDDSRSSPQYEAPLAAVNNTVERRLGKSFHKDDDGQKIWSCQATQLFKATCPLSRLRVSQYFADVRSKNVTAANAIRTLVLAGLYNLRKIGIGYRLSVWLYERSHQLLTGRQAPKWRGGLEHGESTPDERLNLQVGETVEVKPLEDILLTLNKSGHNRGLSFDPEMVRFCGKRFRVAARVEKIINESTGRMMEFSNPCIVLDGVFCKGEYSALRLMCPRHITPYWREIWLNRPTSPS